MSKFSIDRVLNTHHTTHSARSLYKLRVLIERWAYSEPGQRSKMKRFGGIIIHFNFFCKKLNLKS